MNRKAELGKNYLKAVMANHCPNEKHLAFSDDDSAFDSAFDSALSDSVNETSKWRKYGRKKRGKMGNKKVSWCMFFIQK